MEIFGLAVGIIVKFDGTNWTPYTADDGLACAAGFVYSIYADSNGDIWTGSNSSGVTKYSDPSLVFINPIDQTVSTNEIFNTSIEIAGVQNLGSFELELDFDPAFLQANTVTIGSFLEAQDDKYSHYQIILIMQMA